MNNSAESSMLERNLKEYRFSIIKRCIDEADTMHLLEIGCPPDEYDIESKAICELVSRDSSIEQIAQIIAEVFNRYFDMKFESTAFLATAKHIKESK